MDQKYEKIRLNCFCEYSKNPICIQNDRPRFSWKIHEPVSIGNQSEYRILVSSSTRLIESGVGDIWDSGIVPSRNSNCIEYAGKSLKSKTDYYWTVEIQCCDFNESIKSEINSFETGIFTNDEWVGKWIEYPDCKYGVSPLFHKEFKLDNTVEKARIYICGIGYYYLYINGKRIGDRVLEPGFTNYDKRILYSVYDITENLVHGENVIGVELGEGWYGHQHESFLKYLGSNPKWCSNPKLLLEMDIQGKNGEKYQIISDDEFSCIEGPISENSIYNGELYDARNEIADWNNQGFISNSNLWKSATLSGNPPTGILTSQIMPPIRITEEIKPVSITKISDNKLSYDFGQNFAGWVQVVCSGVSGSKIIMRYAETLNDDGSANQANLRESKSRNTYILNGSGEESYEPRFTYHGFRFMEIECIGNVKIKEITGKVIHTDVKKISGFYSSDEILNKIYNAMIWTERSNMHSIPTDCPQRDERMAWLNDMTVRCTEAMYNFDLVLFYEKWLMDIVDEQDKKTGSIPDTAPHAYGGNPSYHVSSCLILIPWMIYLHYGDKTVMTRFYKNMKHYLEFLVSQTTDGIIGEPYYGEWAPPAAECMDGQDWNATPKNIPPGIITTGYIHYDCTIMKKVAETIGKFEDISYYDSIQENTKQAINRKYFNESSFSYATDSQGSNIFPLFLNIVDKDKRAGVINNLLKNLVDVNEYHITTGNQMTKYLFEVLQMEDRNDIALKIAQSKTYPSLGFMIENGATTLWERWENLSDWGMNSHNHPMNGAFTSWLFKDLGGLKFDHYLDQLETVVIEPAYDLDLNFVKIEYESIKGVIKSGWKKTGETVKFDIQIPWNMNALLKLKMKNNKCVFKSDSVTLFDGDTHDDIPNGIIKIEISDKEYENKYLNINLACGNYSFLLVNNYNS